MDNTPNIDDKIYEVPVKALREYRDNPRVGNVPAIAESLKLNGQFRPIVVWRETQEILAGNHTWKAAKELGWETIKVTYVENLTEDQAKKIVLSDNRYGELGGYNTKKLAELLESLGDLGGTGYDAEYLDVLIAGLEPDAPEALTDEDDVPEMPELPMTHIKEGQVWLLGPHRLVCGDSTDPVIYQRLLRNEQVDLVLTDPPYNVAYVGGTKDAMTIQNDAMGDEDFEAFLNKSFDRMYESAKPGAPIYVFHSESGGGVFRRTYLQAGWMLKEVLIWVKDRLVLSRQDYHWQHEPILYGWKPGAAHYWEGGRTQTTVIDKQPDFREMKKEDLLKFIKDLYEKTTIIREKRPSANREHPTMKPVELCKRLINNSSPYQGIVLDPFGGSGSTLIAAHALGRKCYTIELDPRYADVIARRYQEHSGIVPVLEETGEPHDFTKPQPKPKKK
jgi:site-specific DNA-methyltransferase (adenine-specific)